MVLVLQQQQRLQRPLKALELEGEDFALSVAGGGDARQRVEETMRRAAEACERAKKVAAESRALSRPRV